MRAAFHSSLRRSAFTALAMATLATGLLVAGPGADQTADAVIPVATRARTSAASGLSDYAQTFKVTGHRGSKSSTVTENTLASFDRAVRGGATAIELDLSLTKDDKFLVNHDATLDRTTTCTGQVVNRNLADIRSNCRGQEGKETLSAFSHVLDWAATKPGIGLMVELKIHEVDPWTAERITRLDDLVQARNLGDRVAYISLRPSVLRRVEATNPALTTLWLAPDAASADAWATEADGINIYAKDLTAARVSALHAQGVLVLGRVTDSTTDWAKIRSTGADGLLTNKAADYNAWAGR